MSYNSSLPVDLPAEYSADIRENFRALKEDKIVAAATAVTAESATKLATARVISLNGDATGSTTFDGSADVSITVDVLRSDTLNGKTADDIISACSIYGVPAGAVEYFARSTAPEGWLEADGKAVSRTQYPNLFAAVGTIFGSGDGKATFNLPDLRGEFIRVWDHGKGIDSDRTFGSWQADAFQGHEHMVTRRAGSGTIQTFQLTNLLDFGTTPDVAPQAQTYQLISDGVNGIPRKASETRPRNIALLACIKY